MLFSQDSSWIQGTVCDLAKQNHIKEVSSDGSGVLLLLLTFVFVLHVGLPRCTGRYPLTPISERHVPSARWRPHVLLLTVLVLACEADAFFPVEWRWMSGASTTNQNGVCGMAGQFSTGYTPGARQDGQLTASSNNYAYLFAGEGYATTGGSGFLGDVWVYRQTCWSCNGEWAWLGGRSESIDYQGYSTGSTPYPGGRYSPVAWFAPPNLLHVFGGYGKDGLNNEGNLADLWSFNTDTYTWIFLKGSSIRNQVAVYGTKGTPAAGNVPGAVDGPLLLTFRDSTAFMFGGTGFDSGSIGSLSDTWSYTSGTTQWTWSNGPGSRATSSVGGSSGVYSSAYCPGGRYGSATMNTTNVVYLFGGYGKSTSTNGYLADLWAYNTYTNEWAYIAGTSSATSTSALGSYGSLGLFSPSNHPGSRRYSVGYSDPTALIMLFGGKGYVEASGFGHLNDFWAFNVSAKQWSWASGDSVEDQNGNYADSVWFSSSNKPGGRKSHCVSVNRELNLMYVFGGLVVTNRLNDFWATKGPTALIGGSPTVASPTASPTSSPTISPTASPTTSPSPAPSPVPVLKPVEWRWMSGTSTANQLGSCGTAGQYSAGYTPGARLGGAMTTSYNGRIYLFGGHGYPTVGGAGVLGDVWVYRQTCWSCKGEWAWLGGKSDSMDYQGYYTGTTPYSGARYGSVAWVTPPNLLQVHGGLGKDGLNNDGKLSDLWSFNTDTYTWAFLKGSSIRNQVAVFGTKSTPNGGNKPGSVQYHAVQTSKSDGTAIIIGGSGYDTASLGYLCDSWKYNSGTTQWTWVNGPGIKDVNSVGGSSGVYSSTYYPGGRVGSAVMDTTELVYLFGGNGRSSSTGGYLADLWAFRTVTNEWAYIAGESSAVSASALGSYGSLGSFSASNHPGSRRYNAGCSDPNSGLIMLFGGEGYCETTNLGKVNDFWAFNVSTKQWLWASGDSVINQKSNYADTDWFSSLNKPGGRYTQSTSVNDDLGLMYLFGGSGYPASGGAGNLNDIWATKGPTVVVGVSPTVAPPTASPTPSPTSSPTATPTISPTSSPTSSPTISPTTSPTLSPTLIPGFVTPTTSPTTNPTTTPTTSPTTSPTASPTWIAGFPTPTTLPTIVPSLNPTPTLISSGSGTGAGGGIDENTLYLVIGLSGALGLIVVIMIAALFTKRGRTAASALFGRQGTANPRKVVVVSRMSSGKQEKHNNEAVVPQPIINMTVHHHNQIVISNDVGQSVSIGGYAYALYAQEAQDETQLNVQQGDVVKINQVEANGWTHCSVVNEGGESTSEGWYPTAWLQMMDSNPFGQEPILDEDEMPLEK